MGSQDQHSGLIRMPDNPEIWKAVAMADHFEKIQKLPDPIPGVPNFRRVPGYKVYCCGQPTAAALETTLNKVCGEIYPQDKKIIWFNMRQEPTVYINGEPVCARPPNKIGEYAELGNVTSKQLEEDEAEFVRVCEGQMKANDNKVKVVDVNKQEKEVEVKTIVTLQESIAALLEKFPGLVHIRVPICNSASPNEVDFDTITAAMVGSSINTPVILNDQVGLSRATTGSVAACLFKEFQINASFEGLVETVPGMDLNLLKMDRYAMDMKKDALFRGEFEVIKELVSILPDGEAAKRECDKVIDKNGPAKTGGTGIKQLRENIAESKLSYEIMDDAAQVFLKSKIMDNIHKYYFLIAFTAYMREAAELARNAATEEAKANALTGGKVSQPADQLKVSKTFVQWMEEHKQLRSIVEDGKGKLQWERDIPAAALANLESLASTDFKANLGRIIHDIYQTAHTMFSDMPQGDHKKRAKYRFASKTLMRILPSSVKGEIEGLIEKKAISLDLYEILGKCTWKPV